VYLIIASLSAQAIFEFCSLKFLRMPEELVETGHSLELFL
jgi:hypothetical protein